MLQDVGSNIATPISSARESHLSMDYWKKTFKKFVSGLHNVQQSLK